MIKMESTSPILSSTSNNNQFHKMSVDCIIIQDLNQANELNSDPIEGQLLYNCSKSTDDIDNHYSFKDSSKVYHLKSNQTVYPLDTNFNLKLSQSASFGTASILDNQERTKSRAVSKSIKNSSLKRVSFGSSKGSMVETLFYDHKDDQNEQSMTNRSIENLAKRSSNYLTNHQPHHFHYPYFRKLGYRVASDSTIASGSSQPPSKVRVSLYDSAQPGSSIVPAKDTFDTTYSSSYSIQLTLPSFKLYPLSLPVHRTESMERQSSFDSGVENPFRPGGELSREADNIIRLIRAGKPITPTSPTKEFANTLPNGSSSNCKSRNVKASKSGPPPNCSPSSKQAKKAGTKSPEMKQNKPYIKPKPGEVEVKRSTIPRTEAPKPDIVNIKKKSKCKCCVVQ